MRNQADLREQLAAATKREEEAKAQAADLEEQLVPLPTGSSPAQPSTLAFQL